MKTKDRKTMKLTRLGDLTLGVVVGAFVGLALTGQPLEPSPKADKVLKWENLEGETGSDLMRAQTPDGWLLENADGYLMVVKDPEHSWLEEEDE